MFSISVDTDEYLKWSTVDDSLFGARYNFFLQDGVEDVPEYLVTQATLERFVCLLVLGAVCAARFWLRPEVGVGRVVSERISHDSLTCSGEWIWDRVADLQGMVLKSTWSFHDFYRKFAQDSRFVESLHKQVLSRTPDGTQIPMEEYAACCVYRVYVFQKTRSITDRGYCPQTEEDIVKL